MRRSGIVAAGLVAGVLLPLRAAAAPPTETDKAIARTLFEQGRSLAKQGNWAEACPKLAESQRLDPGIGTLYNLADCHEHTKNLAAAWAEFGEVADIAKQNGQTEREKIARERVAALDKRVPRVTLKKREALPPGSDIVLDEKSVGIAVIDIPVPLDPGSHKVAIVEAGGRRTEKTFTLPEGAAASEIDLPSLAAKQTVDPKVWQVQEDHATWQKPLALGVGAAGVVALGVSLYLGIHAKSQWNDVSSKCPNNHCNSAGYAGWEDARSTAMAGNVTFVIGLGLLAGAAILYALAPSDGPRRPQTAQRPSGPTWW